MFPSAFSSRASDAAQFGYLLSGGDCDVTSGFESPGWGGGGGKGRVMMTLNHDFVVITPMIMKFGTGMKLDVFYTMETKNCDVTTIT